MDAADLTGRTAPEAYRHGLPRWSTVLLLSDLHDRLVAACEAGDVEAAAEVAFRTWQNLADLIPDGTDTPTQETP